MIDATDVLVRYTLDGDANLDSVVNVADLSILASNWQSRGLIWTHGDSTYHDLVDVGDLGSLATNWQQSLSPAPSLAAPRSPLQSRASIELIDLRWDTMCAPSHRIAPPCTA
jgi:hypothetical protein